MAFIVLLIYLMRSVINLILITFIFTYLMYRLEYSITAFLSKWFPVNRKVIVVILYAIVVTLITIVLYRYSPLIVAQIRDLLKMFSDFFKHPPEDVEWVAFVLDSLKGVEVSKYFEQGFEVLYKYATNFGKLSLNILISLILSLFFLLEKERIITFTARFKDSKVSAIYKEMVYFSSRFVRSFGKVLEAQFLIALTNCILSVVALWLMGFPQLLGLGIMIFLLGLIPVAGVIISLIPLCTIAYTIGGMTHVIWVVIMVVIIHALESYLLNPKLMSFKTNLPVFYTFIVLVMSEHFLGIWGLIIGIPIFMFLLDVLGVTKDEDEPPATTIQEVAKN